MEDDVIDLYKKPIRGMLRDILCNVPVTEDQYDSLEQYVMDKITYHGGLQYNDGYIAGMNAANEPELE